MPPASRPRLFLLDGTALAYRAHFALARSGLTSMDGKPTGAAYGFTMTLRRILEQEKPDAIAVALDPKGPTFRHKRYAEYKATREKAPEEMIAQLDDIRNIVRAHGIPIFEVPGFEADDVIGTLTVQAEAAGYEVLLVTADKDLMQLVGEHVRLYNIFKRDEDLVMEGIEEVYAKFGTTPEHVIDVLAIMGDASDNVPGVKGIGEKGAAKLIAQFGSVAGVLENLEKVKGKAREYIERDREQLLMSLELVTIDTAMELDPGIEAVGPAQPDKEALIKVFSALDFQGLIKRVAGKDAQAASDRDYVTVADEAGLAAMEAELRKAGTFAWDSETTGLDALQVDIVGLSFSAQAGRAFYVPFNAPHGASSLDPIIRSGAQSPDKFKKLYPALLSQAGTQTGTRYGKPATVLNRAARRLEFVGSITAMDAAIGRLLDLLDEYKITDNTIVIFFSDNGGAGAADNSPLRGRKGQMFEGGIRVPCIVRWPGKIPAGTTSDEFLTSLEIFPMLCAATGALPPKGVKLDGFDMLPVLQGKKKSSRQEMFWQRRLDKGARVGHWKWVESSRGNGLFDLRTDLSEKHDLSIEKPVVLKMMKARFANWENEMKAAAPRGPFRDY